MRKEYKLIQEAKSYPFNHQLATAQSDGWTAMPETLVSGPGFFSVLVQREIKTVVSSLPASSKPTSIGEKVREKFMDENYPNSIGHSHGCGCCVCR